MVEKSSYMIKLHQVAQSYQEGFSFFSHSILLSTILASIQKLISYSPKFLAHSPVNMTGSYIFLSLPYSGLAMQLAYGQEVGKIKPICHPRMIPVLSFPQADVEKHCDFRSHMQKMASRGWSQLKQSHLPMNNTHSGFM